MNRTKEIAIGYPRHRKAIKVTCPGGIIHVECGLTDSQSRPIVCVSVTADGDRYAGDPTWWVEWGKTDKTGGACRIIKTPEAS